MVVHPCLTCQKPTRAGSRCDACRRGVVRQRSAARGTRQEQGYGASWQIVSRQVLERDSYQCFYCPSPATTADHIVPKSRGGSDDPSNLVAACRPCNSAKRDR